MIIKLQATGTCSHGHFKLEIEFTTMASIQGEGMFPSNRYYFCDYFNSKCIKQLDFSWFNSTAVNTNRPKCLEWNEI